MTDPHWFDTLNKRLTQSAPRRGILGAVAALSTLHRLGTPDAEAKGGGKGGKHKNGGKGKKGGGGKKGHGKGNGNKKPHEPDPTCEAVCAQEFELHPEEIPACVSKCNACRIRDNFCVIEGDLDDPTMRATCCFEGDQCCQDSHACCPGDSVCCPGYPQSSPQPCCGKDQTCCPSDFQGCCSHGSTCCPGEGCVYLGSNQRNCGVCGNRCSDDQYCEAGRCTPLPPDACIGRTPCGGNCVDTDSNRSHCGRCHKACRDGEECRNGSCVSDCSRNRQGKSVGAADEPCPGDCPEGLTWCSGACVDTKTNPEHCGGCNAFNPNGLTCCNGNLCHYIDGTCCGSTCYPSGWTCA